MLENFSQAFECELKVRGSGLEITWFICPTLFIEDLLSDKNQMRQRVFKKNKALPVALRSSYASEN